MESFIALFHISLPHAMTQSTLLDFAVMYLNTQDKLNFPCRLTL